MSNMITKCRQKRLEDRWRKALILLAKRIGINEKKIREVNVEGLIEKYSLVKFKADKKSKTKFLILSGASGVGKNEIAKELNRKVTRLPHVTSRPPRRGEVNGREYFFVSKQKFSQMAQAGKFLAYRKTYGDYRGVSKDYFCLLYTSPSPRDLSTSRMPSSA